MAVAMRVAMIHSNRLIGPGGVGRRGNCCTPVNDHVQYVLAGANSTMA